MDPVASFLTRRYPDGSKLVEIGIGNRPDTAEALRNAGYDVVTTDVKPVRDAVRDDVFRPDESLYQGAAAIYLVRPGTEMQAAALHIAHAVSADLVVRPLGNEITGRGDPELVNVDGAPIYVWDNP